MQFTFTQRWLVVKRYNVISNKIFYDKGKTMNLILHIGSGKTGSSALQTFLALNSNLLSSYDIYYPEHSSFLNAKKGFISSGNISISKNKSRWEKYIDKKAVDISYNSLLFSSEALLKAILSDPNKILYLNKKYTLTLVMYIRNPLDHLFSSFGSSIFILWSKRQKRWSNKKNI